MLIVGLIGIAILIVGMLNGSYGMSFTYAAFEDDPDWDYIEQNDPGCGGLVVTAILLVVGSLLFMEAM